ncbi:MAG TPA: hypothetical protein VET65_10055 [Candidatus Limnocylindrales bacterium]|nr:hypothetical protein [Candidatus Limnocylindrales bacterium]
MDAPRPSGDPTRKALKLFGVTVTDFQERSQALLAGSRSSMSEEERQALLRDAAQLTADLHHALQEIQQHVYQLQSDFLLDLVARERTSD